MYDYSGLLVYNPNHPEKSAIPDPQDVNTIMQIFEGKGIKVARKVLFPQQSPISAR